MFRLFERLHGSEQYGGSGVGLAIAQRVVERHGGVIWMDSKPGEGCTFFFSIPVASAKLAASAGTAHP